MSLKTNILILSVFCSFSASASDFLSEATYEVQMRKDLTGKIAAQNLPAIKDLVLGTFKTATDKAYFEKMEKSYKPQKLNITSSEARGQVSIFGEGVDVSLNQTDRVQKSLKVNGVLFQLEPEKSLEYHVQKMASLISRKSAGSRFFSAAYAESLLDKGLDMGRSLFTIIPAAIADMNTYSLQTDLQTALDLCRKKDLRALEILERKGAKGVFSLDGQKEIKDCGVWARQDSRLEKVGLERLVKVCQTGASLVQCVDSMGSAAPKALTPHKTAQ